MTGLIVLAAGSSSRMGRPKQVLKYNNKSLVLHAVHTALESLCSAVVIVVGANAEIVRSEIEDQPVHSIHNADWETGMASSIKKGLALLIEKAPEIDNCIIMVCDQPFVNVELLDKLISKKINSGKNIIASKYQDTIGTPALFNSKYFTALLDLSGHDGAKKLIFQNLEEVALVEFALGNIDIDTCDDYEKLIKSD